MKILLVDDEKDFLSAMKKKLAGWGYEVETAEKGVEARVKAGVGPVDIILLDHYLPDASGLELIPELLRITRGADIIAMTGAASAKNAVQAMKLGAADYIEKPFLTEELKILLEKCAARRQVAADLECLKEQQRNMLMKDHLFLGDESMKKVYLQIETVALREKLTVLIQGETGTGKQHAARLVHAMSPRAARPFVEIHCGALPEALLESELFGHEPGAFTDAKKLKPGLFETAKGGTVFLDEIGELPLATQAKLLKVLEQKKTRRLGGVEELDLDIRIITATNRNLQEEVQQGRFRADLYYRLNVVQIRMPSLQERDGDIRQLALYFFQDACLAFDKPLAPPRKELLDRLAGYAWPGNVRELKNLIESMVVNCAKGELEIADLPPALQSTSLFVEPSNGSHLTKEEAEILHLKKVLASNGGNRTHTAKMLGITRSTLQNKLKKYGIH